MFYLIFCHMLLQKSSEIKMTEDGTVDIYYWDEI